MFSAKISLLFTLCCCALAGAVMALLRILSAPLWLVFGVVIVLIALLVLAAARLYTGNGRHQELPPPPAPFKEYPLAAAALCFLLVALIRLPQLLADGMILSLLLVAAPLLAAAACALRFCYGEAHPLSGPLALLPIFFFCVQLMSFYRSNSNHPDANTFGCEVIVLSLLLMGLYMTAGSKYKLRHPVVQRIWAILPLAGVCMELILLVCAPKLLYQAADMGAATLLSMTGACALLITPLLSPIQPVVVPAEPTTPESDDPAACSPEASEDETQSMEDAPGAEEASESP